MREIVWTKRKGIKGSDQDLLATGFKTCRTEPCNSKKLRGTVCRKSLEPPQVNKLVCKQEKKEQACNANSKKQDNFCYTEFSGTKDFIYLKAVTYMWRQRNVANRTNQDEIR